MLHAKDRNESIDPFHVVEVLTRAKALEAQGHDVIHMEVGEPDFPTPPQIVDAAIAAMRTRNLGYTPSLGLPALRSAIASFYQKRHGVEVSNDQVVITAGASGALTLTFACLAEPGSRWLLADPGYPCNRSFVRAFEGIPVSLPVDETHGFQPTAAQIASAWTGDTGGVLLASPSNPTGTVISTIDLREIALTVRERSGTLIVDEIYSELIYGPNRRTVLADPVVAAADPWIVQSFSKYWQMTGWRLGWLVVPKRHLRSVEKLAQNLFIAPSTPAQHAALAAFQEDTLALVESRRQELAARRDALVPMLEELGFRIPVKPQGAFYVYADASALTDDSYRFALDLLESSRVAVTPGIDFGRNAPQRYLRFAYTTDIDRITEAIDRIRRYLGEPGKKKRAKAAR